MSKTQSPPIVLTHWLKIVFEKVVEKAGGKVIEAVSLYGGLLMFRAKLSGNYYIYLDLEWDGKAYEVTKFTSIESTGTLGEVRFLHAEDVLLCELAGAKWKIRSPKNLLALFTAHSFWSGFWDKEIVFNLDD